MCMLKENSEILDDKFVYIYNSVKNNVVELCNANEHMKITLENNALVNHYKNMNYDDDKAKSIVIALLACLIWRYTHFFIF